MQPHLFAHFVVIVICGKETPRLHACTADPVQFCLEKRNRSLHGRSHFHIKLLFGRVRLA